MARRLPAGAAAIIHEAEAMAKAMHVNRLMAIGQEYVRENIDPKVATKVAKLRRPADGWMWPIIRDRTLAVPIRAFGNPDFWPHGQHLGPGPSGPQTVPQRVVALCIQAAAYAEVYRDRLTAREYAELQRPWDARNNNTPPERR